MIISYKHKYIFIGLPQCGSSAISKELIENYDGERFFHKHSNIPIVLEERDDIDLDEYCIFAVVRRPEELAFTHYNKLISNANGVYTNQEFYIENGGFVKPAQRAFYQKFIHSKSRGFDDYLKMKYKHLFYDNNLSINKRFLTNVIDFNRLNEGFKEVLKSLDIEIIRDLPIYNKTNKQLNKMELSQELRNSVFGPFYTFNKKYFENVDDFHVPKYKKVLFAIFQKIRYQKVLRVDRKFSNNKKTWV